MGTESTTFRAEWPEIISQIEAEMDSFFAPKFLASRFQGPGGGRENCSGLRGDGSQISGEIHKELSIIPRLLKLSSISTHSYITEGEF